MLLEASEAHRVASKCDATTCCVLVPSHVMTWGREKVFELISFNALEVDGKLSTCFSFFSQLLSEYYLCFSKSRVD